MTNKTTAHVIVQPACYIRSYRLIFLLLLFSSCNSPRHSSNTASDSCAIRLEELKHNGNNTLKIKNDLELVLSKDQVYRQQWDSIYSCCNVSANYLWDSINKNDVENIMYVSDLLHKYGWLPQNIIGRHGEEAMYLTIQHSDIEMQMFALPLLTKAVVNNYAERAHWAYLFDRILTKKIKCQLYGTQYYFDGNTQKFVPYPLIYPTLTNDLRSIAGLPAMDKKALP